MHVSVILYVVPRYLYNWKPTQWHCVIYCAYKMEHLQDDYTMRHWKEFQSVEEHRAILQSRMTRWLPKQWAGVTWWSWKASVSLCLRFPVHTIVFVSVIVSMLAVISHCHPLHQSSPSPVECGWGCGPRRAGGAAAWAQSTRRAAPERACGPEECTICRKRYEGTYPSHTGRCGRYRRTLSGIPAWTEREKKVKTIHRFT